MEDSYTVHRRRKAAARKREKTPEPPRIRHDDVTGSDVDEEDARSRMERMVQETEMLEALEQENERKRLESLKSNELPESTINKPEVSQRTLKRAMSPEVEKPSAKAESTSRETTETKESKNKQTSGIAKSPEMADQASSRGEDTLKKLQKVTNDEARASRNPVRRRLEPEVNPADVTEKTVRKKAASPEIDEKKRLDSGKKSETSEENASHNLAAINLKKSSASKVVDETERDATRIRHDENSHERTRDIEAGLEVSSSGKNLKNVEDSSREERAKPSESLQDSKDIQERLRKRETPSQRSSKDRCPEKSGYTTDSSETEEATRRQALRRKKSPEVAKLRMAKKVASRSRPTTDTDADPEDQDHHRRRNEERSTNRRRRGGSSESDDNARTKNLNESVEKKSSRKNERVHRSDEIRSRYSNEDTKDLKKSDTFPIDIEKTSRSSVDRRKQIIPLSDDSLIEDFAKAQRDYEKKERSILDHDPMDDFVDPRMMASLRKRKFSIVETQTEISGIEKVEKRSWFAWLPFFGLRAKKEKLEDLGVNDEINEDGNMAKAEVSRSSKDEEDTPKVKEETSPKKRVSFVEFFRTIADFTAEFRAFVELNPRETRRIRILRNRCIAELLLALIYCGLGAFVFRFTEGAFETFYKCGVKRVKRDFLDSLWNFSHNMREEDWKSMARRKLMEFEEQLHTAHEAGVHSYSGQKSWSFLNAVVYCLTVITTIGYGHISPSTTTGRAITIVYAIFGIPMFLIILADFGKLFTRGIKFLWAFVRRVYYTGSCRRVRRTVPVQEVMKGVQLVYDLATFRRPSQMNPEELEEMQKQQNQTQTVLNLDGNNGPPSAQSPGTPGTPAMSTFAIDDEFNLPISVAIVILLAYIFVGATVYNFWEQWGFFESFYFVFISMSTIGFGDYVPKHPIYMMLSIVYLVFGLALTSMCINVVQVMLSDSFKQASQKIGATIGFEVAEEDDDSNEPPDQPPVEIADVHMTIKESESEEQVAPKAKQEDVEL